MGRVQLSNMKFPLHFCIIPLIFNWAQGEAIQGDNVKDAAQNEFTFVVALIVKRKETEHEPLNNRQFCTGSLITKKHVLTAEHCLLSKNVHEVEVLVGSTNLDQCKAYSLEKWTTYQEWKYKVSKECTPSYQHDVAIITLKECVVEKNTTPVIVAKLKLEELVGTNAKIAGWGFTNGNVKPMSLKTADLKVVSNEDCQSKLSQIVKTQSHFTITDRLLCATSEPWALNACGDSGGPLLNERNEIIGITLGTCPQESVILDQYPILFILLDRLMEKRMNLHANLNYYEDFLAYFTNQHRRCSL